MKTQSLFILALLLVQSTSQIKCAAPSREQQERLRMQAIAAIDGHLKKVAPLKQQEKPIIKRMCQHARALESSAADLKKGIVPVGDYKKELAELVVLSDQVNVQTPCSGDVCRVLFSLCAMEMEYNAGGGLKGVLPMLDEARAKGRLSGRALDLRDEALNQQVKRVIEKLEPVYAQTR